MPCRLPDGRGLGGVVVGVGVEPEHGDLAALLGARAGDAADRAHRDRVVAAEEDRHAGRPRPSRRRGRGWCGSSRRSRRDGGSGRRGAAAMATGAARDLVERAAVGDAVAEVAEGAHEAGGPQRLRSHRRAARRGAELEADAEERDVAGLQVGDLGVVWRLSSTSSPYGGEPAARLAMEYRAAAVAEKLAERRICAESAADRQWTLTERQMRALDEIDRRLIALLRDDARMPSATLARRLGVSRGTVQNRIDRLVAGGRAARLHRAARAARPTEAAVRAIMAIEVRSADTRAVVAALRRMPEVGRVHSTNGRWDLVAEIDDPRPRGARPGADGDPGAEAGGELGDEHPARGAEVGARPQDPG